jgi:hypothetical protein
MNACRTLPLAALLSISLAAQDAEPATIGVQARFSKAEAGLKDVAGSSQPGLGVSLVAEIDYTEGFRARLDIGYDLWQKGGLGSDPGDENSVAAFHIGVEGVMMLNPDELRGPYVLAGLGGYAWNVQEQDTSTGLMTKSRASRLAGTLGLGFRMAKHLDLELKILAGKIETQRTAAALQFGVTYRFNP